MCSISVVDKESIRRANKEIHIKRLTTLSVGEDVEKRKLSYSAAGDVKWHIDFGKHFGSGLELNTTYHMIQLFHY